MGPEPNPFRLHQPSCCIRLLGISSERVRRTRKLRFQLLGRRLFLVPGPPVHNFSPQATEWARQTSKTRKYRGPNGGSSPQTVFSGCASTVRLKLVWRLCCPKPPPGLGAMNFRRFRPFLAPRGPNFFSRCPDPLQPKKTQIAATGWQSSWNAVDRLLTGCTIEFRFWLTTAKTTLQCWGGSKYLNPASLTSGGN